MILIDDRAGSRDLIHFPSLSPLASLSRLNSADVCFTGNGPDNTTVLVGIEVKSLADLLSSVLSARLQCTQIPGMLKDYDIRWLIYYGVFRKAPRGDTIQEWKGNKWRDATTGNRALTFTALKNCLAELTLLRMDDDDPHGFNVDHVTDLAEVAEQIAGLYTWWQKPWTRHKLMRNFDATKDLTEAEFARLKAAQAAQARGNGRSKRKRIAISPLALDRKEYQRARTARSLPGIRAERAIAAASHFRSPYHMFTASAEEWSKVPGIGKTIAKSVVTIIREE